MTVKGITIWERYIERIVLAIAVLTLVGFTAMQFVGEPNAVTMDGRSVAPGEVDRLLEAEAQRLLVRLAPGAASAIDFDATDFRGVRKYFQEHLTAAVSPAPRLVRNYPRLMLGGHEAPPGGVAFVVPQIPAPRPVIAGQTFDALTEEVVNQYAALSERFPTQPADLTWVTPAAVFESAQVLREFRRQGPDGEPAAIPLSWYNDRVRVLDVIVERQELTGGEWTDLTTLEPIPGQRTFRPILDGDVDVTDRQDILRDLADPTVQTAIIQPPFYATRNDNWAAPKFNGSQVNDNADAVDEDTRRLREQLERALRQRDKTAKELEDAGGPLRDEGDPGRKRPGGRDDGGKGRGGDGPRDAPGAGDMGQGAGRRRDGKTQQDAQRNLKKRRNLTARLDRQNAQIARLREQLGEDADAVEDDAGAGGLDSDQVLIWVHDLTVEPGRTYRYRFTVEVYNPFFARKLNLVEAQHELADSLTLSSLTSEWSDQIEVRPMLRFFVAKASTADRLVGVASGLGHAEAEVFRFHDGRWWSKKFKVEPGDRIGALVSPRRGRGAEGPAAKPVDFGTDWFVLDIIATIGASRSGLGDQTASKVLLQCLSTGVVAPPRDPRDEAADLDREWLTDEVEAADSRAG